MFSKLLLCLALIPIQQFAVVIEQQKKFPESSSYNMQFIDLGETDIPIDQLNKFALPVTYAPQINDQRQVNCNQSEYGVLKGPAIDSISPQIASIKSKCYGINSSGDMLLGFERHHYDIDWMLWSQKDFNTIGSKRIDLDDVPGTDLHLRAINDSKIAVGLFKPAGMLRPVIWTPEEGLHHLGYYLGWDIAGVIWDVNSSGTVIGYINDDIVKTPFVWSKTKGLTRLAHFKQHWKETTHHHLDEFPLFADLVISEGNLLYGTFWANPQDLKAPIYAFWWDPQSDSFRKLDLDGMRINAISSTDTLVGSWNGQAALSDPGNRPVALATLVKDLSPDWKLVDATDINSHGDIVGYALFKDKPHYFMLKRL